jgi:hypothetical protein
MFDLLEAGDLVAIWTYLTPRMAVIFICWAFVANFADFASGVSCAKALGEHIDSHGLRRTFRKIGDYYLVMLFFLLFDVLGGLFAWYTMPFASIVCSVGVIYIECRSVLENSRRKQAHAAELPEAVREIIQCATKENAVRIIKELADEAERKRKEEAEE